MEPDEVQIETATGETLSVEGCVTIGDQRVCGDNLTVNPVASTTETASEPAAITAETASPSMLDSLNERIQPIMDDPMGWAEANLLQPDVIIPYGIQLGVIIGVFLAGFLIAPILKRLVMSILSQLPENLFARVDETSPRLVRPALWAGGMWIAQTAMASMGQPDVLVRIATSLAIAWLIIRLATTFLPDSLRMPITWLALGAAVLNAFGVLGDVLSWSATVGPDFGGRKISPPFIVQAVLTAALFLFAASWLSTKLKTRVEALPKVEPSLRILMSHAVQIGLFFAAAIFTLAGLGIPLSGLAVLGGAFGIGIGFGMQQIVANFISGVILLTDRSIKPNDVIEVDNTYGVVKSLGLRYASVITRDGKEHLIPNEMLITDKVINWSYSDTKVRIKRRIRVEYESDLRQAVELVIKGISSCDRVLSDPAPKCQIKEFGEEAIELEARFWVSDPHNGISNIGSEAMLAVWDEFKKAGIDIPLRHEDILITPGSTLKVEMVKPDSKDSG